MSSNNQYFVTGIGTDVGKTVVSAVLVKALEADYWKPIQSGDLHESDSIKIRNLCEISGGNRIHKERFKLYEPIAPHAAAQLEGRKISLTDFTLPATTNSLIVEGAGGVAVPLNTEHTILDLIKRLELPVMLVVRNYLGSINHTLLSIAALRQHDVPIKGMVVFGDRVESSEEIIVELTNVPILFSVGLQRNVDAEFITKTSNQLKETILAL